MGTVPPPAAGKKKARLGNPTETGPTLCMF